MREGIAVVVINDIIPELDMIATKCNPSYPDYIGHTCLLDALLVICPVTLPEPR